jgi:hypothetical protein
MGNIKSTFDETVKPGDGIQNSSQSFAARMTESQLINNEAEETSQFMTREQYKQSR